MSNNTSPLPALHTMTGTSDRRWGELLDNIADLLPAGDASVVVDGSGGQTEAVADRLAATLRAAGRPCSRLADSTPPAGDADAAPAGTVVLADGPVWRTARDWDVVIWLRTDPASDHYYPGGEVGASIVIDLNDPAWPVIRRVAAPLARHGLWYIPETRAFFSVRAATWDSKFGDDLPAYAAPSPRPASLSTASSSTSAAARAGRCRPCARPSARAAPSSPLT